MFFTSFNMFNASFIAGLNINSTAADAIKVDALRGVATVMYNDGGVYEYTNVSRRAIMKFIMDDARSLGKFINNVLKQERVSIVCG